ncbi:unnamed protein product [Rotaria sp. Silwood2]|nr:unnamed protein product [Rotaria sp. Silwood2]
MIRRLRGGKTRIENMPILDKQGNLLCSAGERLERFKEYFNELLNVKVIIDPTTSNTIQPKNISPTEKSRQEKPPTIMEVKTALKQIKSEKAPGNDGITVDLLKYTIQYNTINVLKQEFEKHKLIDSSSCTNTLHLTQSNIQSSSPASTTSTTRKRKNLYVTMF